QWIVEVVSEETFEEIEEVEEIVEEEVAKEIIAHQEETTVQVVPTTTTMETTTETTMEVITTTEDEHVDVVVPELAVTEGCPVEVKEDTKESQIEKVVVPCEEVDVHETTTTEIITETTTTESTTEIITTTEDEHVDVVVPKVAVIEGCPIDVKEDTKESQVEKVVVPQEEKIIVEDKVTSVETTVVSTEETIVESKPIVSQGSSWFRRVLVGVSTIASEAGGAASDALTKVDGVWKRTVQVLTTRKAKVDT
ncbi:hypothetical protein BGZ50_001234, partial [Haplosporangium sp. Z 11]